MTNQFILIIVTLLLVLVIIENPYPVGLAVVRIKST